MRSLFAHLALPAALAAAALLAEGCGSGSGTTDMASVRAAAAAAQPRLVLVAPDRSAPVGTTLTVEVAAPAPIRGVYGGGFELRYDPAVVRFERADTAGSALSAAKDATALRGGRPGVVVFGRTKEGDVAGEDVQGAIVRLHFRALAAGRTTLTLEAPAFLDAAGGDIAVSLPQPAELFVGP